MYSDKTRLLTRLSTWHTVNIHKNKRRAMTCLGSERCYSEQITIKTYSNYNKIERVLRTTTKRYKNQVSVISILLPSRHKHLQFILRTSSIYVESYAKTHLLLVQNLTVLAIFSLYRSNILRQNTK